MSSFNIALLQLDTQGDKSANLKKIGAFIDEAASKGVQFITMPEMCTFVAKEHEELLANAESIPGPTTQFMSDKAKKYGIWIHGGSIYESIPGERRLKNTTVVYNPKGEIVAKYSKIHLYDVEVKNGVSFKESDSIKPGDEIVSFDSDFGRMGLAICYDIRFCELYRILALRGAKVIFNPAEFALYTGKDHWESLIRARAIENVCYMVCADQIGVKPIFQTYGRSIVVDPWGNVIAKASDREGILYAEIDVDYVDKMREQVPCLTNRRPDTYKW